MTAATDELTKFETELKKFTTWLDTTSKELDRQVDAVKDMENVNRVKEQHKVIVVLCIQF